MVLIRRFADAEEGREAGARLSSWLDQTGLLASEKTLSRNAERSLGVRSHAHGCPSSDAQVVPSGSTPVRVCAVAPRVAAGSLIWLDIWLPACGRPPVPDGRADTTWHLFTCVGDAPPCAGADACEEAGLQGWTAPCKDGPPLGGGIGTLPALICHLSAPLPSSEPCDSHPLERRAA